MITAARTGGIAAVASAILLAGSVTPQAFANDTRLRGSLVPAVSCLVAQNSPRDPSPYQGGGFYKRSTRGTTALDCPLPIVALSGSGGIDLTQFRVHYRDFDGRGQGAQVVVALHRTYITSRGVAVLERICSWDSNTSASSTSYARALVACRHTLRPSTFYTLSVVLTLNAEGREANFLGVDFP